MTRERGFLEELPRVEEIPSHFWPRTSIGWIWSIFNIACLILLFPIGMLFNKPVPVMGLPMVEVWHRAINIVWIVGILVLGYRQDRFLSGRDR